MIEAVGLEVHGAQRQVLVAGGGAVHAKVRQQGPVAQVLQPRQAPAASVSEADALHSTHYTQQKQ